MRKAAFLVLSSSFLIMASAARSDTGFAVDVVLDSGSTAEWEALTLPPSESAHVEGHMVVIEPGAEAGWHVHPFTAFMVLEGALTVELEDETQKVYRAGDALLEDANT